MEPTFPQDGLAAKLDALAHKALPKPAPKSVPIGWASQDPRTGKWVDYASVVSEKIESAHSQGLADICVEVGKCKFTVSFHEMRQYNANGGSRPMIRKGTTVSPWA